MLPLTENDIRDSFANATLRERKAMNLPGDLGELDWDRRDYLGWRDRKVPQLGYVVAELDGRPTGILLRQGEGAVRSRPLCNWCEDVQLPNDVVFFSARRAGAAGRRGSTIGTLVCAHFECSVNVRRRPPVAYVGFDVEAARDQRIVALGENVRAFVRSVLTDD